MIKSINTMKVSMHVNKKKKMLTDVVDMCVIK